MRLSISDHLCTSGELVPEATVAPRSDDLNFRSERRRREFKANLIVAFASCAVSNRCGALCTSDLDHSLRDERTCNAGAQKIFPLINRTGLKHRKNKVARELLLEVIHIAFLCAGFKSLLFETVEFLGLAYVCAESDDLRSIDFLKPI